MGCMWSVCECGVCRLICGCVTGVCGVPAVCLVYVWYGCGVYVYGVCGACMWCMCGVCGVCGIHVVA